jgi:iron complex transport system permease protein
VARRTSRLSTGPAVAVVSGCLALLIAVVASTVIGAGLPVGTAVRAIFSQLPVVPDAGLEPLEAGILWDIRFPRVVLSCLVGATLGLCGCAYQGAFRNPLVDPYLLGSAAGAGFGATLAIVYAPSVRHWPIDPLPVAAFVGALAAVAVSYLVGQAAGRQGGRGDSSVLVLAGIAVGSFFTALQTLVQQQGTQNLRRVYAWLLGGLVTSGWSDVVLLAPYVVVVSVVIFGCGRYLDVLSVGDDEARTLGVSPERIRLIVVIAASLGTAAAVSVSGLIGFVGLVVPHVVRLLFGSAHRLALPASALFGGAFLAIADLCARTIISPAELPIGVVTAFFGAPFFALLLIKRARI